jgi:amidase
MERREFILLTAQSAAILPFLSVSSCMTGNQDEDKAKSIEQLVSNFELLEFTIEDLQKKMESGELSSKMIVQLYLDRIKQIDKDGFKLNSVIEINPDALSIAENLDQERKSGNVRSKMHGIPVLIKDNIDTHDKMMTTAGSLALAGNIASKDAFIVELLRKSGAVILGKTNLSEFANFRSTRSVSGWSSRGGQTKNPYVIDRNPCGSSSGSGTAVSANLCTIAIGTETDGSIICPSAINGIVGIKPTVGLWSRSGIIPISFSQDTAGPMARTVTDAAILLGLLAGTDNADSKTSAIPADLPKDYTQFLDINGLKGKRIGLRKSQLNSPFEKVNELLKKSLEEMKAQGTEIIEFEDILKNEVGNAEYEVLLYEFKDGLNKYLSTANAGVKTLAEVIEFNKKNEDSAMPYFQQEILEMADAKGDLNSKEYKKALKDSQEEARKFIDKLISKYKLDAICGVSYGPAWCTDFVNGDHFTGVGMDVPYAVAGYPAISVPMGFTEGLPIGLTFTGKAFDEGGLISLAFAFEQHTKARKAPEFISSIEP